MELFKHTTDGGAAYLVDDHDFLKAKIVIRLDGGAELSRCEIGPDDAIEDEGELDRLRKVLRGLQFCLTRSEWEADEVEWIAEGLKDAGYDPNEYIPEVGEPYFDDEDQMVDHADAKDVRRIARAKAAERERNARAAAEREAESRRRREAAQRGEVRAV